MSAGRVFLHPGAFQRPAFRRDFSTMPHSAGMVYGRAGGANVPALNDLLRPYGIAFGDAVLEGQAALDGEQIYYASGANIVRFPAGGYLHAQSLADKAAAGSLLLECSPFQTASGQWCSEACSSQAKQEPQQGNMVLGQVACPLCQGTQPSMPPLTCL